MSSNRNLTNAILLAGLCASAFPALGADTKGYLYGSVVTRNGTTYEGRLRWGKEEAFWTDHFNATKDDLPLMREIPRKHKRSREQMKIFGIPMGISFKHEEGRQLVVRFGDLKSIIPGSHDSSIVLKNGDELEIGDGSNDIGAVITVWDRSLGEVNVPWKKLQRVDFKAAPADLGAVPARLHGTVKTTSETLKGYIQWDKEECLATDRLDGETDDGKLALEMGQIKAIERRDSRSSRVFLKDGRDLVLSGTNDVDSDNRGIYVDDPRYGRVLVSWKAFERVDFDDAGSGPGYDDFPPLGALRGVVKTVSGASHHGSIVFDVDESQGWETLDGEASDLNYSIPFAQVASVSPSGDSRSRVTLIGSPEELRLKESADVTDRNAGVFILEGGRKTYVPWEDVKRIDFETAPVTARK